MFENDLEIVLANSRKLIDSEHARMIYNELVNLLRSSVRIEAKRCTRKMLNVIINN